MTTGEPLRIGVLGAARISTEAIVALESGAGIDLRLVDDATGEDVLGRGKSVASQRLCAGKTSRKAKLEVRVDQGPAPALVLLRTEEN